MNACPYIRTVLTGLILLPVLAIAQNQYAHTTSYDPTGERTGINRAGEGAGITSNVPLNEINIHAFRHFHRRYPAVSGESWVKSADGYIVSFMEDASRHQAHFDSRGAFLYTVKYYTGKELSRDCISSVKKKFPDYAVGVVTEISNGEKTFYFVRIANNSFVKTLSIVDGKIEVVEELINGGVAGKSGDAVTGPAFLSY
jgi:hypothetical protein